MRTETEEKLLRYIPLHPHDKMKSMASVLGITLFETAVQMKELYRKGIVIRLPEGEGYWAVSPNPVPLKFPETGDILIDIACMLMIEKPSISTEEIADHLYTAQITVARLLRNMKSRGIVVRTGTRRNGKWMVRCD
ncbi:MAG: hypothetical protein IKD69_15730 [Solobacterium sp.]|nr:hypothetical protein [Solobacterium sp.]